MLILGAHFCPVTNIAAPLGIYKLGSLGWWFSASVPWPTGVLQMVYRCATEVWGKDNLSLRPMECGSWWALSIVQKLMVCLDNVSSVPRDEKGCKYHCYKLCSGASSVMEVPNSCHSSKPPKCAFSTPPSLSICRFPNSLIVRRLPLFMGWKIWSGQQPRLSKLIFAEQLAR